MRDKWISFGGKNPTEYVAACLPGAKLRVQWIHTELRRPLCARRLHKMFHETDGGNGVPCFQKLETRLGLARAEFCREQLSGKFPFDFAIVPGFRGTPGKWASLERGAGVLVFRQNVWKNGEDIASVKMILREVCRVKLLVKKNKEEKRQRNDIFMPYKRTKIPKCVIYFVSRHEVR